MLPEEPRLYLSEEMSPENPFWNFSLSLWRHNDLRECLLSAQDDYGMRISYLLYLTWLATKQRKVNIDRLMTDRSVLLWQNDVVDYLRSTRKKLTGEGEFFLAMKAAMQNAELKAEQWEMAILYKKHTDFSVTTCEARKDVLLSNIVSYTEREKLRVQDVSESAAGICVRLFETLSLAITTELGNDL